MVDKIDFPQTITLTFTERYKLGLGLTYRHDELTKKMFELEKLIEKFSWRPSKKAKKKTKRYRKQLAKVTGALKDSQGMTVILSKLYSKEDLARIKTLFEGNSLEI